MSRKGSTVALLGALLVFTYVLQATLSHAETVIRAAGHVPAKAIARATHLGRVPSQQPLNLSVVLKMNDEAQLAKLIEGQKDPEDQNYGKFLTAQEFSERFAPSPQEIEDLKKSLRHLGLTVLGHQPNRLLINVSGTAAVIESAFHIELHQYQNRDGRKMFSTTSDPEIPAALAARIKSVVGLNSFFVPHRLPVRSKAVVGGKMAGSAPTGGLAPSEIRSLYGVSSINLTGAGESVALVEIDGYVASDVAMYAQTFGISPPPLQNVLLGGFSGNPGTPDAGGAQDEVSLDIEMLFALTPGLANIYVYEGLPPNTWTGFAQVLMDIFNRISTDNLAKTVSVSYGFSEDLLPAADAYAINSSFMQMAAQGQTVFVATGDTGAYLDQAQEAQQVLSVNALAAAPYATAVGGTSLTNFNSPITYVGETSWGVTGSTPAKEEGGGGGISTIFPLPSWQVGLASSKNLGSNTFRMIPDVSLDSDPSTGYSIYTNGAWVGVGGTSAAAPLWAGFMSLVNQQRVASGLSRVGFANPAIYRIGQSSIYSQTFNDISDGSTNLYFPTEVGYDLSTGWGSHKASALFNAMINSVLPPLAPTGFTVTAGITN